MDGWLFADILREKCQDWYQSQVCWSSHRTRMWLAEVRVKTGYRGRPKSKNKPLSTSKVQILWSDILLVWSLDQLCAEAICWQTTMTFQLSVSTLGIWLRLSDSQYYSYKKWTEVLGRWVNRYRKYPFFVSTHTCAQRKRQLTSLLSISSHLERQSNDLYKKAVPNARNTYHYQEKIRSARFIFITVASWQRATALLRLAFL